MNTASFRRPLGLVLAGGGAHGAWQAGAVHAFAEAGLVFDRILGVSIGSLSGAAYAFGELGQALAFWRDIDRLRLMRLAPRLRPLSLFSDAPLWAALAYVDDDERLRSRAVCDLTVVTVCKDDGSIHYARFSPEGRNGWDGPAVAKLIASCSVPIVFPPQRLTVGGVERLYVDGSAQSREWISYGEMAGCADVLVLHMIRPEEFGGWHPLKRLRGDPLGADILRAMGGLKAMPGAPRVWRLYPSSRLDYHGFDFRAACCAPAVERGIADAESFLSDPEPFLY